MTQKRKHIMLTLTQNCNLRCTYCYENFKSKERMTFDIAKESLEKHLTSDDGFDECVIEFHGGEPFLEFDLIRELCEYTWSKCWQKPYLFFATTNGSLIHGKTKSWVNENKDRVYLALSLDGTKEMHNINRSKSFSRIDIEFFKDSWPDQPVKMTISKETLPKLAEGVIYLHSLGFKIQNNLAYGVDWSDESNIDILFRELKVLADFYLKNPNIKPCELFDMEIKQVSVIGQPKQKWCGVGTNIVAIDTNGNEYPCHYFLPVSIGEEKSFSAKEIDFSQDCSIFDSKCNNCILQPCCPTCYGVNYSENNNTATRNNDLCNLTKIRALACSYLNAMQILQSDTIINNYTTKEKLEKALIIDSIKLIQNDVTLTV